MLGGYFGLVWDVVILVTMIVHASPVLAHCRPSPLELPKFLRTHTIIFYGLLVGTHSRTDRILYGDCIIMAPAKSLYRIHAFFFGAYRK